MINIKVTERYYIGSDPLQYIVMEKKTRANPKADQEPTYFQNKTFHGTIDQALKSIFDGQVKASKAKSWEELSKVVAKQNELLKEIKKKLEIKGWQTVTSVLY